MNFIMLFFPGIIGLNFYMYLKKGKLNMTEMIMKYGIITFLINFINMASLYIVLEYKYTALANLDYTISFIFKYMLSGLLLSLVVGFALYVVEKSVELDVEVKKERKKNKKSK